MGASEILEVLRKGDKLTASEIAEFTDCSICAVQHGIKRLVKDISENIELRPLTPEEKKEKFGRVIGAKINLYWLDE